MTTKTLARVRKWWDKAQHESWHAEFQDAQDAIEVLVAELDKRDRAAKRPLAKAIAVRVSPDQFRTIANARITCTLLVTDRDGVYHPGMLGVVSEYDPHTGKLTQRQTLRLISHVWQAMPGYDSDTVVLALQPLEEA